MDNTLSLSVQMQYMRPTQLEAAARKFPVVYVPFGLIEWHGKHLPLGTDALKAHGVLVKTAEKFGGVVYPPIYYPYAAYHQGKHELHPNDREWKFKFVTSLFESLKDTGFRVIVGVSGHNTHTQITLIKEALESMSKDGEVTGIGLWEFSLSECDDSNSDHAAKWETSNMLFLYPQCVDMKELGNKHIKLNMEPPDGILGLDPREHASTDVGQKNIELASDAIGRKAKELLESLPKDKQNFNIPKISPEHWWSV